MDPLRAFALAALLGVVGCTGTGADRIEPDRGPDAGAPAYPLGDYMVREERALARWKSVRIRATNGDLHWPEKALRLLADAGLNPVLDSRQDWDEFEEVPADWAEKQVEVDALEALRRCLPERDIYVDDEGRVHAARRTMDRPGPPPLARDARTCERLVGDLRDSAELRRRLESERISLPGRTATLYDTVDEIQETARINVVIAAAARRAGIPDRVAEFSCRDETLESVFLRLAEEWGLVLSCENRVVLLSLAEDASEPSVDNHLWSARVRVGGTGLAMRDLARQLGHAVGMDVVIDPVTWRRSARFDLSIRERSFAEVVELLRKGAPLQVSRLDGRLWFLEPAGPR